MTTPEELLAEIGRLKLIAEAARKLAIQANGSLLATGYSRGSGNVVMVLEVSVNNACDLRDALEATDQPSKFSGEIQRLNAVAEFAADFIVTCATKDCERLADALIELDEWRSR